VFYTFYVCFILFFPFSLKTLKIKFFLGKKCNHTKTTKQQMSLTPENESQMEYFAQLKREIQSMETQIKNAQSEANDKIKILQNTDEYKQLLENVSNANTAFLEKHGILQIHNQIFNLQNTINTKKNSIESCTHAVTGRASRGSRHSWYCKICNYECVDYDYW
jgi:glutamine synthetase type III